MKLDIYTYNNKNKLLNNYQFKYQDKQYTIPAGFEFDGGSIPRVFWFISHPLYYKYLEAFLIHDWFYSTGHISRYKADKFFALMIMKHNIFKAVIFFLAVRLFGFFSYNYKT